MNVTFGMGTRGIAPMGPSERRDGDQRSGRLSVDPALEDEASFARHLLRMRRRREKILGKRPFADPAWDMFLDLFASEVEGQHVAMSSLVVATAGPQSTALRWMSDLTRSGRFEQYPDAADGRRTFIRLSRPEFARMTDLLQAWRSEARKMLCE